VLVGENASWKPFDATICQIEMEAAKIKTVAVRYAVHDLLATAKTILLSAKPKNLRAEFESSAKWYRTREKLLSGGHDEVVLWIEELMN
jgi:hypothetical protein